MTTLPVARHFVAKKAFFSFLGASFRIFGTDGTLQYFIKQKAFKLKEELNVFADEGQTQKRLTIKARQVFDVSATYDVTDVVTGESVGACRRQGLKSILRDSWEVVDGSGGLLGTCKEDSMFMALLRRFIFKQWLPERYTVADASGNTLGTIRQRFNPFILSYDVSFDGQNNAALDPRLGIALVVLLLAIEGRQQ